MAMDEGEIAALLRCCGLRATRQRIAVAKAVAEAELPVGASEVHSSLSVSGSGLGLATVYRALTALERAGVVQRQPQVGGGASHYQLPSPARESRGQVVCSRCGKVEEFDLAPEIARLGEALSARSRFADSSQPLYIVADCRHKENPETCK